MKSDIRYKNLYRLGVICKLEAKKEMYMSGIRWRSKYWEERPMFNTWKIRNEINHLQTYCHE